MRMAHSFSINGMSMEVYGITATRWDLPIAGEPKLDRYQPATGSGQYVHGAGAMPRTLTISCILVAEAEGQSSAFNMAKAMAAALAAFLGAPLVLDGIQQPYSIEIDGVDDFTFSGRLTNAITPTVEGDGCLTFDLVFEESIVS
jgi:hypothetical protein